MRNIRKVDKMTETIEFHILPLTPNGKGTTTTKTAPKKKTAQVKKKGDSPFPTDGHKAILNKLNRAKDKQKADEH